MARVQDFQTVIPTDSDNLLVVQATGQGLATVGSTLGAKMDKANPTGTGSLSLNKKSGTTLGTNAVAVGYQPTASGDYSFAEGYNCTASGIRSHAEGTSSVASGNYSHAENSSTASNAYAHAEGNGTVSSASASHAEGNGTTASGAYAHAEGNGTTASGYESHAEGTGTIANHLAQHVFGQYNLEDTSSAQANQKGTYIEIVGKGANTNSRSNARTLDWSGNEVLAGDLTIKGSKSVNTFMTPTADYITPNLSGDLTYGTRIVYKSGGICVINLYAAISTPIAGTNYLLGTLPQGFRPSADTIMLCAGVYGGTSSAWRCNIGTDGKIITSSGSNTFTGAITVAGAFVCAQ